MTCKILQSLFFIILLSAISFSQQKQSGDMAEIKEAIIGGNNITTILYNYGSICKPNFFGNIADLVWNGLGYMFEFGPILAAEVINDENETLHIIDDSFILPTQGTYSPDGTQKWGWLPKAGYANPDQNNLATKNNMDSWPPQWSGWLYDPEDLGNISKEEAFYVMDDFSNASYNYYPFTGDTTKRGLAIETEVRVFQFDGNLKDALIVKYKLSNVSDKNLDKVYFGFHTDPHIGGAADYSDDRVRFIGENGPGGIPGYDFLKNVIYLWDEDQRGMGGAKTGYLSFKLLQSPDDLDITSFHTDVYTNSLPNVPKNHALMWKWLSGTIDTTNALYHQPGDNIINFGTGPFKLSVGESKELVLAIFLSDDYNDMVNDAAILYWNYTWALMGIQSALEGGSEDYKINLTSFNGGTFNSIVPLQWQYTGSAPNAELYIEISSNNGRSWRPVDIGIPVNQLYNLNTENFKDGVNYLLRIVAYNPSDRKINYFSRSAETFTIDNPMNAQPELHIFTNLIDTIITDPMIQISWLAQDADNFNLLTRLEFSVNPDQGFNIIHSDNAAPTGYHSFNWETKHLPNGQYYYLRITLSDGNSDTSITTGPFRFDYYNSSYKTENILHLMGRSTAEFYIQIIDNSKLTEHTYEITFKKSDEGKIIDIIDYSIGKAKVENFLLTAGVTTPEFDGIKLLVDDKQTGIDYSKSSFNRSELNTTFTLTFPPSAGNPKVAIDNDWAVIFNDLDTSDTGNYLFPADTLPTNLGSVRIITPFKIFNTTENERGEAIVFIPTGTPNLSRWKTNQNIILRPQNPTGAITTYQLDFDFSKGILPHAGDTLNIITHKGITSNDVYRFALDSITIITGVAADNYELSYQLFQNYPNPFNPTTTISFRIPASGKVQLKIFDLLGREVCTLINENMNRGEHSIKFNANGLASAVYLYQLRINDFISTKKFILLK
jgi:hypothetical protein